MAKEAASTGDAAVEKFATLLNEDIVKLLADDFGVETIPEITISYHVLCQVGASANESLKDLRHHFDGTISTIKYISILSFWLVKLKPVSVSALKVDGELVTILNINEQVALDWALQTLFNAIQEGRLVELIAPTDSNIKRFSAVLRYYMSSNIYRPVSGATEKGSIKFDESVHYFRFKRVTSIYIYEMLLHMIVGFLALSDDQSQSD